MEAEETVESEDSSETTAMKGDGCVSGMRRVGLCTAYFPCRHFSHSPLLVTGDVWFLTLCESQATPFSPILKTTTSSKEGDYEWISNTGCCSLLVCGLSNWQPPFPSQRESPRRSHKSILFSFNYPLRPLAHPHSHITHLTNTHKPLSIPPKRPTIPHLDPFPFY